MTELDQLRESLKWAIQRVPMVGYEDFVPCCRHCHSKKRIDGFVFQHLPDCPYARAMRLVEETKNGRD